MSLLPGLIDAHLHSANNNPLINTFLKNGVTTMRDPGHPFRFYQSLYFAKGKMPRVYLTGAHFDGYPGVYTQQATLIKSRDHIAESLKDYVQKGGTGIKIYFRLPLMYFETVIKTADFYHIPVVAHLELVAADDAIRAGLKGVEHVTSFGTSLADPKDALEFREAVDAENEYRRDGRYLLWSKIDLNTDRVKEVIELAAKENVVISPTLATFERQSGDKEVTEYQAKAFENMLEFVGMAHKAGVTIVTGSHTSGKYAKHGWAYQREMELLVKAGLTPLEAISSSTMNNAQYFRTDQRIGSIEAGKLADLLLVEGDPSVDISRMYEIQKVMLNGEWVDRAAVVE
jgi:imidazolonepropionase-like amidohydrolase